MAVPDGVYALNNQGFFDILLPFLLVFVLTYAILNKLQIFGPREKTKNMNVVMGLILGALFVAPHVMAHGSPYDMVDIVLQALPQVSVIMIAIMMVLLVFGIWGSKVTLGNSSLSGIIAAVSFLLVVVIFANAAWGWPDFTWLYAIGIPLISPETRALVVTILVFAIIIWWVTRVPTEKPKEENRLGKFMGSILSEAKY